MIVSFNSASNSKCDQAVCSLSKLSMCYKICVYIVKIPLCKWILNSFACTLSPYDLVIVIPKTKLPINVNCHLRKIMEQFKMECIQKYINTTNHMYLAQCLKGKDATVWSKHNFKKYFPNNRFNLFVFP